MTCMKVKTAVTLLHYCFNKKSKSKNADLYNTKLDLTCSPWHDWCPWFLSWVRTEWCVWGDKLFGREGEDRHQDRLHLHWSRCFTGIHCSSDWSHAIKHLRTSTAAPSSGAGKVTNVPYIPAHEPQPCPVKHTDVDEPAVCMWKNECAAPAQCAGGEPLSVLPRQHGFTSNQVSRFSFYPHSLGGASAHLAFLCLAHTTKTEIWQQQFCCQRPVHLKRKNSHWGCVSCSEQKELRWSTGRLHHTTMRWISWGDWAEPPWNCQWQSATVPWFFFNDSATAANTQSTQNALGSQNQHLHNPWHIKFHDISIRVFSGANLR